MAPGNIVKGVFEVQITFTDTEDAPDQLNKACKNTRYKLLFNEWTTFQEEEKSQGLQVSSIYEGEYPTIIEQIESEAHDHFKDFHIIRIKIQSSAFNNGVPQHDLEKQFLWNDITNYFQLSYKFSLEKNFKKTAKNLRQICRSLFENEVQLSHIFIRENQFILTIYLLNVGRINALIKNGEILKYFTTKEYPPSTALCEFIVYDTNIRLDKNCTF